MSQTRSCSQTSHLPISNSIQFINRSIICVTIVIIIIIIIIITMTIYSAP